jgi:hypothetical protein
MDPPTLDLQVLALNLPENSESVTDNMTNGKREKFRDNPDIAGNDSIRSKSVSGNFIGANTSCH